jgi:hypothetical protein
MTDLKVLTLDIETSPNLGWIWDIWKGIMPPKQVVQQWDVMMVGTHWLGSPDPVKVFSAFHDGYMPMLSAVWEMMDEADAALTYNGKRFDRPRLKTVWAINGFTPPSPTADIDLDETIRREFQFPSHSLDYASRQFGLGGKVPNSGFDLWLRCMQNEAAAWDEMVVYCGGDVTLTEEFYFKVRPWIKRHPSLAARTGEMNCVNCGSANLIKKGFGYTLSRAYQRLRCSDCGKPQRSSKAVPGSTAQVVEG